MAHIIIVHEAVDGSTILLNADKIISAQRVSTTDANYTDIAMTDNNGFRVREALDELRRLCGTA